MSNVFTAARVATEQEAARATAMAEEVITSAKEEIARRFATVSTPALMWIIEDTMDDILWAAVDSILTARGLDRAW